MLPRRARGPSRSPDYGNEGSAVLLQGETYVRFRGEARRRGLTPDQLARRLLELTLADSLIEAVLGEK